MLMAGSMEAGYSLPQAVDTVVREGVDPISSEFNRALIESRLGVPIEDALESVAERMQSQDFDWVVMAIRIQRQVGGSLADVLKTVAETLRERERLRRMVRALSADGRLSAWIISLAPFFVAAFLILFRPEYVAPLFQQTIGWIMIGFALVLIAIGAFIISRIIKVEL
jgi:tight adherence protein B